MYRITVAYLLGFWLAVTGCVSASSFGRSDVNRGPSARAGNGVHQTLERSGISLELSGEIEWDTPQGSSVSENGFRFRKSIELRENETGRIDSLQDREGEFSPLDDVSLDEDLEDYSIDITPVAVNDESVVLQIRVLRVDHMGKVSVIASPRLVAPYGLAAEVRELNPRANSAQGEFSRLRISLLPQSIRGQ